MNDGPLTVTRQVHFRTAARGSRRLVTGIGAAQGPAKNEPKGVVPRISRLMALAIRCDTLLREGAVRDQAELAELAHVSRARITQIMNLMHLAPDIQEALLDLPLTVKGDDPIREIHLRPIAAEVAWSRQRAVWQSVKSKTGRDM